MARASDGASGPALGKPARVSPGGGTAPVKVSERTKAVERGSRPARFQVTRVTRLWGLAAQFLSDVRAEMNRVAWPDRQTVIASTIVVLFVLIITASYLAGWDYLFAQLFSVIFRR